MQASSGKAKKEDVTPADDDAVNGEKSEKQKGKEKEEADSAGVEGDAAVPRQRKSKGRREA